MYRRPQNSTTSPSGLEETPIQPKRKGRFNIALYAKRRKLVMEQLVEEKIVVDAKVKSLQNKINYRKRKVGCSWDILLLINLFSV